MIDLHAHTNESDGTLEPAELVRAAVDLGLEALGVCDHDTFAGYDQAAPIARRAELDIVCGIELSTRLERKSGRGMSVHVLGYFLDGDPPAVFRNWIERFQRARRDRNRRLAARLQSLGIDIRLEEVTALGRSLAGRPHFARLMVEKGYVPNYQAAFDQFLAESAKAYVERDEASLEEGVEMIARAGGLASLAHPVRLGFAPETLEHLVAGLRDSGLRAIEVYHSDHGPRELVQYRELARRLGLAITGGTDFHGDNKPGLALGTGYGNVAVPRSVLDDLRAGFQASGRGAAIATDLPATES